MTGLICLALISSLSSLIMVGPRVTQALSEDLSSLRFLARNNVGAPVCAIILQAAVAIFLTLTATFNTVLTYVGYDPGPVRLSGGAGGVRLAVSTWRPAKTFQDVGLSGDAGKFSPASSAG